jgi:hypothetical protein
MKRPRLLFHPSLRLTKEEVPVFKKLSAMALALSVAGLVGCGVMPGAPVAITAEPYAVAAMGEHGNAVTLDFAEGLAVQATVHRWMKTDIIRYDVLLQEVLNPEAGNDQFQQVGAVVAVDPGKAGVKFTGLSHGKRYRAYVKVMGNKGGDAALTLHPMNLDTYETEGEGYVVYDFIGNNDIEDNQKQTIRLKLDAKSFSGTGDLAIVGPEDGEFDSAQNVPTADPYDPEL